MALAKNPMLHGPSKQIDIRYHYNRELIKQEEVKLQFYKYEEQVANIMTKPLKTNLFEKNNLWNQTTNIKIK